MAKTAQEIKEQAEETVSEVLEMLETTEKKNDSFFRHVPKWEVSYLISSIRHLSTTVLNLSKTAASAERLIALKDEEIDDLNRKNLSLVLDKNHLEAKLDQITKSSTENNEKD